VPLDPATLETTRDYAVRTVWALVVVAIALLAARIVRAAAMRSLARHRAQANATILLGNIAQVIVLVLGTLVILAIYTQSAFGWILTSFSAMGIVIGLSLQDILKNFFAGIWILVERPFRIGDEIEIAGYTGEVQEISFRTTQLRTADGRQVVVPNGNLMTSPLANMSRYPLRRAAVWLALPADEVGDADPAAVRAALADVAEVATDPAPSVELRSVADGKAQLLVTFWAKERESGIAGALSAVRARFPHGEVHRA